MNDAVTDHRAPLTSWKDIGAYLKRSERTVQRWEKEEGLPVRRLPNSKSGTVFAYPDELDEWLRNRLSDPAVEVPTEAQPAEKFPPQPARWRISTMRWWIGGALAAAVLGAGSISTYELRSVHPAVRTQALTAFSGTESCPTFSPDGKRVAFVWRNPASTPAQNNVYTMNIGDSKPFRLTDSNDPEFSPVWSPDGKTIALLREIRPNQVALILKPVAGGAERVVTDWTSAPIPFWEAPTRIRHFDWTPDGRSMVISAPAGESRNLFLLSLATGERRTLTQSSGAQADLMPAVSPDGKRVAFLRETGILAAGLWMVEIAPGAEPRKVEIPEFEKASMAGVQWSPDGHDLIFVADAPGAAVLWRTRPFSHQQPIRVEGVTLPLARNSFVVSRDGSRIAYGTRMLDMNVWTMDADGGGSPRQVTRATRIDYFGRFSPDGSKIVFASNQTGAFQIWICDRSGANAQMITNMDQGTTGAPVWSPDGKWIAFDSRLGDNSDIYKVAAAGGPVIRVTDHPASDVTPAWSLDSKSVYFSSNRSGRNEIWKIPEEGGASQQITHDGGTFPMMAPAGDRVYFIREHGDFSVWSVPAEGGEERSEVERITNRGFVPARDGIYYLKNEKLLFRATRTGRVREIAPMRQRLLPILDLSSDGKTLSITQIDSAEQDLMLIDHLRW